MRYSNNFGSRSEEVDSLLIVWFPLLIAQLMYSTTERGILVSNGTALCFDGIDGRCAQLKRGLLTESSLFQPLWRLDFSRDNEVSDNSEGEMEQAEDDKEMVLEEGEDLQL